MQKIQIFWFSALVFMVLLSSCNAKDKASSDNNTTNTLSDFYDSLDRTNDFYDNAKSFALQKSDIIIDGEIENPGQIISFSGLNKRSVLAKETRWLDNTDTFMGAYQYTGYSLYDILNDVTIRKRDTSYAPIIELFVEVENENGEKVVFSWGEIFYPANRHQIILATDVRRIVPSKTNELWKLPVKTKIVAALDLVSERNISAPVKITIKTPQQKFVNNRDTLMLSKSIDIDNLEKQNDVTVKRVGDENVKLIYPTVFYGRGRGIHKSKKFEGYELKNILGEYFEIEKSVLQKGLFVISGIDGYRGTFSFSEVMNRNDQSEVLLVYDTTYNRGGWFRLFPSADFFSDRAIKSVNQIIYFQP